MNSAKIEAGTKCIVKLGLEHGEIIDVLWKFYVDNVPKKSSVYKWRIHFIKENVILNMKPIAAADKNTWIYKEEINLVHGLEHWWSAARKNIV